MIEHKNLSKKSITFSGRR